MNAYVTAIALLSLRLGPVFVLSPPFSLIRVPQRVRVCLVLALSALLAPVLPMQLPATEGAFVVSALSEVLIGLTFALALQLAFAALSFAGRVLDVQAGYGLAMVIDPGTRAQSPLFGTIFVMAAAVIFFANNGHLELVRVLAASAHAMPIGLPMLAGSPQALIGYLSLVISTGFGAIAAVTVTLFLIDLTIALLSRALPQMNALMLGLQVKTIATLVMLTLSAGLLAPVALRLIRYSLDFMTSVSVSSGSVP
ncbi:MULTISPECIES: flagellar biosynthetic protein FliR [unclassified Lysobacter]|uniref:flagellar biosynthetic protein FliR n=1 Tax=unclassified Lysobacter TaxID=2635362 RepID=UPI001BE52BEA|nr:MULTISPECIES: flagellar biosynthetic protein FliR [unclassified Lysobacter]MBT2745972.1 flagellar biosynthetic protein FliR [Lysobacter sp. ISL-42]MBT2752644.1 flagellar biosynthetic protein FliR [Lysobacter sp. ISL-50]MBT2777383.1 flagellar biosynthetic protein FliR [Lysobacter sp. ISL-54]MBT2783574.1 flagellar biosynthetic protein FliR [Lysobacter sp. ISL-52]